MAIDPVFHNIRFTSRSDTGVGVVLYGNGSCKVPGIGDVIADALFFLSSLGGVFEVVVGIVILTGNIV